MIGAHALYGADGRIQSLLLCEDADLSRQQIGAGTAMLRLNAWPGDAPRFVAENYVSDGALTPRTALASAFDKTAIAADGAAAATITGLPNPSTVSTSGAVTTEPTEVTDGELVITSNVVGAITVTIDAGPQYQLFKATLHAT